MPVSDYRDLRVWQRSMDLVVACNRIASALPPAERFGLASQLRRSALSIPSNISEGNHRIHLKDYLRCVSIARGSLAEVTTQLELARRLEYVSGDELESAVELADHVGRMLTKLVGALRRRLESERAPRP